MTNSPKLRANITTRYGEAERAAYEQVMELARRTDISKSRMQLILVQKGLLTLKKARMLNIEGIPVRMDLNGKLTAGKRQSKCPSQD